MKNRIYIFVLLALVFSGCQDYNTGIHFNNESELIVSLDIPEPVVVKTRSGIKDELSSLCVLVFDKNGLYLSKHNGELVSSTDANANYKFGGMPVTKDNELLILHFVANYDWTEFSDAANIGKGEAEVMNKLTVANDRVTYWQRVELPDGLVGNKGTTITLKNDVSLLRNVAKITVENLTNEPEGKTYLTDVTFAVGDYMDKGTVAPYSTASYKFVKGAVTEALDGKIVSITDGGEFLNAQNGSAGAPSDAKYVYERKNSMARNQTYIIIKAFFQSTLAGVNTTIPSYYKIDIANESSSALPDIERNCHYIIRVNDVAMEGYPTLKEAMNNPASNNINASVQVAEYTSVSDGTNILQIEKAVFTFVTSGQHFQIKYSYFDGINGRIDNTKVTVSMEQKETMRVIKDYSYSDGIISGTTANIPVNNDIYQMAFIVSDGRHLSRRITIRLRKPMTFLNVSAMPNAGIEPRLCKVANAVGQPVTIIFSFPPDVAPEIFPLPVYVYSAKLSPDPTKEGIQPLAVDPNPDKTFRYIYMAPYLGNDKNDVPMPHAIYLVTSTPSSNEDVILASDYFNDVPIQLKSENMPALSNIKFDPNPVLKLKEQPVVLTFDIPEVTDKPLPYKMWIHTDYLEYVSTARTDCVWDNAMGAYCYTTHTAGSQNITFKTTRAESGEYVRLDGDCFASVSMKRTIKQGEFKDMSASVLSGTAGSPVDILFSFDEAGSYYAVDGVDIFFTTQYLEPASGSGIVPTGKSNEYRMHVASSAQQTAKFSLKQSLNINDGEKVRLSATGFKDTYTTFSIPGKLTLGSNIPGYEDRPVFTFNDSPTSLSELLKWVTVKLNFNIPASTKVNGEFISTSNPLWLYYECSVNTQYLREESAQGNIAEFWQSSESKASRLYSYKRLWFKITSVGNKTIELDTDVDNDLSVITLMSVSDKGVTVSNDLFKTATNIQKK